MYKTNKTIAFFLQALSEFETGVLHIKPPTAPVDIGDYFVMWADEVTIAQNLFNRLVAFWITK